MIISLDATDKIQHLFSANYKLKEHYNLIKGICEKATNNTIYLQHQSEGFPLRLE